MTAAEPEPAPEPAPGDPVALARALIRRPSVTPDDAGALDVVQAALEPLGFVCHRLTFQAPGTAPVANLYARLGTSAPNFAFAGHVDVVPPGDPAAWRVDPFAAEVVAGELYGRGAVDMKGAIACFVAAVARFLAAAGRPPAGGSISLLLTADEEGPAVNGTAALLRWLEARGERIDACVVGEPTNPERLGEVMKVGRRGSLSGRLTVFGRQGHVAYPERADNPIPRLLAMLRALLDEPLDAGSADFQPSNLEVTSVDVGNRATNVIPATARAAFNVRFNDRHTAASLEARLRARLDVTVAGGGGRYDLELEAGGEAFWTPPGPLRGILADAALAELGLRPKPDTSGGTSDARFIKDHCPAVVEFGLVGRTMHQVDERVGLADLEALTRVYRRLLEGYFRTAAS